MDCLYENVNYTHIIMIHGWLWCKILLMCVFRGKHDSNDTSYKWNEYVVIVRKRNVALVCPTFFSSGRCCSWFLCVSVGRSCVSIGPGRLALQLPWYGAPIVCSTAVTESRTRLWESWRGTHDVEQDYKDEQSQRWLMV